MRRLDASPPRLASATRTSPVLRVIEASRLLLHEDPDPGRVERLVRVIARDGVLRNPPIVAALSGSVDNESAEGDLVLVLDGANRMTALRELGMPHVAAQVVRYDAPEISVSTWTHYVLDAGEPLSRRVATQLGIGMAPASGPDAAARRLRRGDGIAALTDAAGTVLVRPGMDPIADAGVLRDLVAFYVGASDVHRIDTSDLDVLRAEFGPGTVVTFPRFDKGNIVRLARGGGRLPAGITRHVIPGRALRLNIPLPWLRGPEPTAVKQARLDGVVEERWRTHGVRYYAEATYLFDE